LNNQARAYPTKGEFEFRDKQSYIRYVNRESLAMTIEITKPELEALIQHRIQSGAFASAEDVILQALRSFNPGHPTGADLIAAIQASPYKEIDIEPTRDRLRYAMSRFNGVAA
jgi:Arc/MetJ-type ribon-helix-helix transcriptional regulator